MKNSEIRKHYFEDIYVIIAPKRAKRPHNINRTIGFTPKEDCFFCPENSKEKAVYEIHENGKWIIKVVNNAFPALTLDNKYALGKQEVIIETPEHEKEIHALSENHIKKILNVYTERYESLSKLKGIRYVLVFKNEGGKAGASVSHCHSQIIALPMVPPVIREEMCAIERYTLDKGICPYCDIIKTERKGPRKIYEDGNIFALVPFASESPYGFWVLPKRHIRTLSDLKDEEKDSMARCLKKTLAKIDELDLSYNYFFHNSLENENHHLVLKVAPRPNIWAGLELGTGVVINSIVPEEAAKYLRS